MIDFELVEKKNIEYKKYSKIIRVLKEFVRAIIIMKVF